MDIECMVHILKYQFFCGRFITVEQKTSVRKYDIMNLILRMKINSFDLYGESCLGCRFFFHQ